MSAGSLVGGTVIATAHDAIDMNNGPLSDFGIGQSDIPVPLELLAGNPYRLPDPLQCSDVTRELSALNGLLGDDIDSPRVEHDAAGNIVLRGATAAHDAALGFIRGRLNIIPLRGVIRQVSGARQHDKDMQAAMEAGRLRRAYLKGVAQAKFGTACATAPRITTAGDEAPTSEHQLALAH